jgi:hypothetical protein
MRLNADALADYLARHRDELDKYEYYGVRVIGEQLKPGDTPPNSYRWEDGNETDEELDGACCIDLRDGAASVARLNEAGYYYGGHAYIIAGNAALCGEDPMELVISDSVVICELPAR